MSHITDNPVNTDNVINLGQHRAESKISTVPADLAGKTAQVRTFQHEIETAVGSALKHALNAGDILAEVKAGLKGSRRGSWGDFVDGCGLSARTAEVYMQLAAARADIMAANPQSLCGLSIAGALRLVRPKPKKPDTITTVPALSVETFTNATPQEQAVYLDGIGLDTLLAAMSPEMVAEVNHRANTRDRLKKNKNPASLLKGPRLGEFWEAAPASQRADCVRAHEDEIWNILNQMPAGECIDGVSKPGTAMLVDDTTAVVPASTAIRTKLHS